MFTAACCRTELNSWQNSLSEKLTENIFSHQVKLPVHKHHLLMIEMNPFGSSRFLTPSQQGIQIAETKTFFLSEAQSIRQTEFQR